MNKQLSFRRDGVRHNREGPLLQAHYGSVEIRQKETAAATQILGLDWRGNLGLPNRSLQPDLEARRRLAVAIRELRPRWLMAPYWEDSHPDHVAASQLVDAARFWAK